MMSPAADAMPEGLAATHIGAELRAARERFGWSLVDVSANLRIRYAHLAALEEGRIADLPGLAYAIGFLRAYAKLLGLDPDEMSRRLRAELGTEPRTELEFPAPVPERGVPAGVVVLLGAVLAIGAYIGWYRMSGDRPGPAPMRTAPDRVTLVEPPAPPAAKPAGNAEQAAAAAPETRPSAPAALEGRQPGAPSTVSGQPAGGGTTASVPPSSAAAAMPGRPQLAVQPQAPGAKPPSSQSGAQPAAPASEPPHIMVRARGDAWVQVRDRQGQVLLSRLMRPGETWQVPPGAPGRQLLLTTGNAGGTELVVDGVAAPSLGAVGVLRRDLLLDPTLIREGKLQSQLAATRAPAAANRPESAQQ
jgi:cytoskeleton protein RodZ